MIVYIFVNGPEVDVWSTVPYTTDLGHLFVIDIIRCLRQGVVD